MSLGVEVGGWFASACVGKLVDKVFSYISDQYVYEANVKQKLKCLAEDLRKIQGVLIEADKRRIQNSALHQWLQNLKDACYEAEDILDIFEYNILEDKVEKTLNQVSNTSFRLTKRARNFAKWFFSSDEEVKKLNDVVDKFRIIITDVGYMQELIKFAPTIKGHAREIMQSRETTSSCSERQLFGRDEERSNLIKHLLEINNSNDGTSSSKNVHVLSIVGIGGVGKTTLVQDVYNNQNVKGHFDLSAWVCVSDNFDVKRLVKEIIESARIPKPHDFYNLQNFDSIQEILKSGLIGKKFLIVLDDVWNEVASKWEILQALLNFGGKGSRVVVTTRNQKIGAMMGTQASITLKGLPEDDFWRFFAQCAFGDMYSRDYQSLEPIGRQVAKKLGCNPLASKTVGAVLKCDLNVTHWREVSESKWWLVDQQEDGIMPVLRLSYDYLPIHLKQCFIYCSLFPRDHKFSVSKLVRLWVAHGFIHQEEIGLKYFDELFSRSFFQVSKYDNDSYVIHDLLHDLARQLSNDEIFDFAENNPIEDLKRVRHVCVGANNLSLACKDEYMKKNLRSLVVFSCDNHQLEMLKELRGLRVLIIKGFVREMLPESTFAKLIHLRYLEIEGYEKRCLPKSLSMLYHLQVISAGYWTNDDTDGVLPDEINRLVNLRHLDACTRGVAGIGTLTLLQELNFFVNERESGFEMGQLQHMSDLKTLEFRGLGRVGSKQEACKAMLENKKHLKELRLYWMGEYGEERSQENHVNDEEVLEGLRPHPDLEILQIGYYCGRRSPQWWTESWASSCSHLQNIELRGCPNWEVLPPIGLLPHLKTLKLSYMRGVKRMGRELYANYNNCRNSMILFPSLETLTLWEMSELMEWWKVEEDEYGLFPRLSKLEIWGCPKLRGGPLFLPSQLKVLYVGIGAKALEIEEDVYLQCEDVLQLIEWVPLQNLSSIEQLIFEDAEMTKMGAELEEWFQHLSSLRSLSFEGCSKLECLPSNLLSSSSSSSSTLQKLEFSWCKEMKSLPEEGLPTSLQELEIRNCSSELAKGCRKDGREWHKISHIPNIHIDG